MGKWIVQNGTMPMWYISYEGDRLVFLASRTALTRSVIWVYRRDAQTYWRKGSFNNTSDDAPIKVFGDIHGQYQDLMRFFDLWGIPNDNGDIDFTTIPPATT